MGNKPAESAKDKEPTVWDYVWANRWLVGIGVLLLIIGAVIGRMFPPFIFDGPFWYDFFSGAPAAGLFAVAAAWIAYLAARHSTKATRKSAEQTDWWNRAEWAIGLALSESEQSQKAGLETMRTLVRIAAHRNDEMIVAVAQSMLEVDDALESATSQSSGGAVDSSPSEEAESVGGR